MLRFNLIEIMQKIKKENDSKEEKSFAKDMLSYLNKALFLSIMVCISLYLFTLNCLSTKGFELRENKTKLTESYSENSKLEIAVMDKDALQALNYKVGRLKMVKVEKVAIINTKSSTVAKK